MGAVVRVTKHLDPHSNFGRQLAHAAGVEIARRMELAATGAVAEADRIVSAEFANERSPARRRTGRHLLGSFKAVVIWDGVGLPVALRMSSLAEREKVRALNDGSERHTIPGPLQFPVAQRKSRGKSGSEGVLPSAGRFAAAYAKSPVIKVPSVNHPGNKAHYFLERALEHALGAEFNRSVSIPRRR